MEISTTVTIPDYVYFFYRKLADQAGDVTVEQVMSRALLMYAGSAAAEVIEKRNKDKKA